MRTRTARWLLILTLLALPAVTAVGLVGKILTPPPEPRAHPPQSTSCQDALELRRVDQTAGVKRLRALLDAADGPTDPPVTRAGRQRDRLCAADDLRELQPPTVSDRVYSVSNGVVGWLGRTLARRPLSLGPRPSPRVAAGVVLVEGLLVLLGVRQFLLWRRERLPGPIQVGAISPPPDDPDRTGLGEIIRERLSRAGIPPGTAAPGELGAVLVEAVDILGGEAQKGWLAQALAVIGRAVRVQSGFVVSGKAFLNGDSKQPAVTVEVTVVRTGATFAVLTAEASSYESAAVDVAYELYLQLARRPSIATRTPSWLAWSSVSGLRHYGDAMASMDNASFSSAHRSLDRAAVLEPANLLVGLRRGVSEQMIAIGDRTDNAIRTDDMAWRRMCHLRSVQHFLRASLCAPRNDDAVFQLAAALSYVDAWIGGFLTEDVGDIDVLRQVVTLTNAMCETYDLWAPGQAPPRRWVWPHPLRWLWPHPLRRLWAHPLRLDDLPFASELPPLVDHTQAEWDRLRADVMPQVASHLHRYFQDVAISLWRWAGKRQRLTVTARRSLRLAHRREVAGRRYSGRLVRRYCALAGHLGTKWDKAAAEDQAPTTGVALRLWFPERRVRVGRYLVRPSHRQIVDYNLAAAQARKVVARGADHGDRTKATRRVMRSLQRSAVGGSTRLGSADLEAFFVDPVFRELQENTQFREWTERFAMQTKPQLQAKAWGDLVASVRTGANATRTAWDSRAIRLAEGRHLPSRTEVVNWFRHDEQVWASLARWSREPAVVADRLEYERLTNPPPPNPDGRPELESRLLASGVEERWANQVDRRAVDSRSWAAVTDRAHVVAERASQTARQIERRAESETGRAFRATLTAMIPAAQEEWAALLE